MSIITSKVENGVLTLFATGRIDSTNAPTAEAEVDAERAANPHDSVVLDIDNLQYISSAGLRALKRLHITMKKKEGEMVLKNVNRLVMEVFEMTGFAGLFSFS